MFKVYSEYQNRVNEASTLKWRHRVVSILGMEAGIVKNMSLFSSSIRSVMQKYLEERHEITFDKIFNQRIGKSGCSFGRLLILVMILQ